MLPCTALHFQRGARNPTNRTTRAVGAEGMARSAPGNDPVVRPRHMQCRSANCGGTYKTRLNP